MNLLRSRRNKNRNTITTNTKTIPPNETNANEKTQTATKTTPTESRPNGPVTSSTLRWGSEMQIRRAFPRTSDSEPSNISNPSTHQWKPLGNRMLTLRTQLVVHVVESNRTQLIQSDRSIDRSPFHWLPHNEQLSARRTTYYPPLKVFCLKKAEQRPTKTYITMRWDAFYLTIKGDTMPSLIRCSISA